MPRLGGTHERHQALAGVGRARRVATDHQVLQLAISDDGIGGADPARGSGIVGLNDRVEALGGWMEIFSPAGLGTSLRFAIPVVD